MDATYIMRNNIAEGMPDGMYNYELYDDEFNFVGVVCATPMMAKKMNLKAVSPVDIMYKAGMRK